MRKSQLARLKKDAEEAWSTLGAAKRRPQDIVTRFEALPGLIADQQDYAADARKAEEHAIAALTKPLEEYAHRDWRGSRKYGAQIAKTAHACKVSRATAEDYLDDLEAEYAIGPEAKLATAEETIEEAQRAFDQTEHAMCQYAIFYARQRKDIDLVWTSEDEGKWTLNGTVAGLFNGTARKIGVGKLILYLLEPHSHRTGDGDADDDEWEREVKGSIEHRNTYRVLAKDLYRAMSGLPTNGYVDIAGCTVQVRKMRAYLRLCGPILEIELPEPDCEPDEGWGYRGEIQTRAEPEGLRSHRATWKHVAGNPMYTMDKPNAHIAICAT